MRQRNHRRQTFLYLAALAGGMLAALSGCRRAPPASGRQVWAEVDGQPIYRDQVEKQQRRRSPAGSGALSPEQDLSFKLSILDELINNQILVAHAARAGISVSEAEVDTRVAQLESPFGKEEFAKRLHEQGLDAADLREEVRNSLIISKLINKEIQSRIAVTDADLAAYYERNKPNFNVAETTYHLAQIEVTPTANPEVRNLKNDDANTPAAAERKVRALYARLQAGEDFATMAQDYSEDPKTASGGGDMGFFPASALDPNPGLKQAVSSLKVGGISGIIHTPEGYHILKLLGKEDPGQRSLADPSVASSLRRTLESEKEQLLKAAYIEDLRNRARVVNYLAQSIVTNAAKGPASP